MGAAARQFFVTNPPSHSASVQWRNSLQTHRRKQMKAFFAGLGTGYALGMLVAPKAGRELRQDFRATTDELRNQTEQQISRLKQTVGDAQPLFSRLKQDRK